MANAIKILDTYPSLRNARAREDLRTESFFGGLDAAFLDRSFAYTNNQGKDYLETAHGHAAICSTIRRTIECRSM
jgi:hypothetical protein